MSHNSQVTKECLDGAQVSGIKASIIASFVMAGIHMGVRKYSRTFRSIFNASTRTALTVMPIFYTGYLNMERHMHACMGELTPEYVLADDDDVPN